MAARLMLLLLLLIRALLPVTMMTRAWRKGMPVFFCGFVVFG